MGKELAYLARTNQLGWCVPPEEGQGRFPLGVCSEGSSWSTYRGSEKSSTISGSLNQQFVGIVGLDTC